LVSFLGGALAVLLAWLSLDVIQHFVPADIPRFQQIELNGWVLAFSLAIAIASGVVAGLWPALKLSRPDVRGALHAGGRGSTSGAGVRRFLVGAQVALTLVLLSVSGLVLRSLERMQSAALGFDVTSTLTFSVALPESRYGGKDSGETANHEPSPAQRFYQNLVDQLKTIPGVTNATVSTTPPLSTGWQSSFSAEGVHGLKDRDRPLAEMAIVSDDYFATLKVPILQGRAFGPQDATGSKVVIVDQAFANKFWPGQDVLGKRVNWGVTDKDEDNWFTIIGVVPTLRVYGYGEPTVRPQAYWSLHQFGWLQKVVLVRTAGNPRMLERQIRELFAKLDGDIALYDVATMQEQVESTYQNTTLQSFLLSLFAGLALLLALTGLYSIVAYGVSMRRREIGVRMALGAQAADVIRLMLGQGMMPLVIGVIVGLAGAFAAGRAIQSQLYEVSPTDPLILAATTALLALAAALACWMPARRAANVNPTEALRSE
ncbi:MAG TPA: FtsX-like permease family protein, partial [Candidatus Didemnitutus sp.]|nr:FtsX-like permease family protein [Candidatus Didemnitutus sp.]